MFFDEDEDAKYLHDQGECDPAVCEFCASELEEDEYLPLDAIGLEDFVIESTWEDEDNDY